MGRKLLPSKQKEHHIEAHLVKKIKELDGIAYKFTSPQRRSVPDRLCVLPGGYVLFIECKRPGEEPTEAQYREQDRLKELDQWVYWVSTTDEIDKIFNFWKERLDNE